MSNKRYQVAICNTHDLEQERAIVSEALAANDCISTGFAFPNPTDNYLWKLVQRAISDADIVLILLGNQYGAMSKSGVGYVHQALAHAKVLQKPIYALIYDDSSHARQDQHDRVKLQQFQQQLCQYPHQFWRQHDELRDQAELVLEQCLEQYSLVGWLPASHNATNPQQLPLIKKQLALLNNALQKERQQNHYASADFAQQEQCVSLDYQCNAFRDGTLIKVEGTAQMSNKTVFHLFAPTLMTGGSFAKLKTNICQYLQQNEIQNIQQRVPKAHAITQMQIDDTQLEKLLLSLRAFGLLQWQNKQWFLTPFGDHLALKNAQQHVN